MRIGVIEKFNLTDDFELVSSTFRHGFALLFLLRLKPRPNKNVLPVGRDYVLALR